MPVSAPPIAFLRSAATILPQRMLARVVAVVMRGVERSHPKLVANLATLPQATVLISPTDLPYRFSLTLGQTPVSLSIVDRGSGAANAEIRGDVGTLLDLLEGRIDSDSLFFRRDLVVSGDTAVVVGLRNVLDREELSVARELGALCGPFRRPARAAAQFADRALDGLGRRVAAMHRTLHPSESHGRDVAAEVDRCRTEVAALTARLAALEARQRRRDDKLA